MKKILFLLLVLLIGCKYPGNNKSGALIDMTNAGADVLCGSNTITGVNAPGLSVKILEKYDTPIIVVEEVIGMKSYPNAEYSKTIKKYSGQELSSVSIENVHPLPAAKPDNLKYFLTAGVLLCWIISKIILKILK